MSSTPNQDLERAVCDLYRAYSERGDDDLNARLHYRRALILEVGP